MRRIPVQLSVSAKAIIDRSTRQGRIFPQALSEFFGTLPDVDRVEVDVEEGGERISIDIKASDESKDYQFFIAVEDITQPSKPPGQGFVATRVVDELLRLYRTDVLREGSA
jgi:hypothetical protein